MRDTEHRQDRDPAAGGDAEPGGVYHIRLASLRASWFPETIRRLMAELPSDVDAIIDLGDVRGLDRFSARALGDALRGAAGRRVSLAVSAADPDVRRMLFREKVDRWASIASDMTSARTLLGILDPQPLVT